MMASLSGTIYIGMTNDIFRRVMKHKEALIDGFAKQYGCNRLVWFETYSEVLWSIRREKELKGWTRAKKIALIESLNPRWEDLAENWGQEMLFPNQSIKQYEEQLKKRKRAGCPGGNREANSLRGPSLATAGSG